MCCQKFSGCSYPEKRRGIYLNVFALKEKIRRPVDIFGWASLRDEIKITSGFQSGDEQLLRKETKKAFDRLLM